MNDIDSALPQVTHDSLVADGWNPLDSGSFGYMGSLHSPIPRYWYVNVRKTF